MSRTRKFLMGLLVAAMVLGGTEVGAQLLLGAPITPPVASIGSLTVELQGDTGRLVNKMNPTLNEEFARDDRARLLVLGGSSVKHMSPDRRVNFPTHLAQHLDAQVINAGAPGATTSDLAMLWPELQQLEPAAVVIYAGHNDFSRAIFTGRVPIHGMARMQLAALLSRSWIATWIDPRAEDTLIGTQDKRMRASGPMPVPAEEVLEAYAEGLDRLLEAIDVPVVLSTLGRNFDAAPEGVLAPPGDEDCWDFVTGLPVDSRDVREELITQVERTCAEEQALVWWYRAHLAQMEGRHEEAMRAWHRSLELDPVPLRAPVASDAVLRAKADEHGVALVDLDQELGSLMPGSMFLDTLHPSEEGARRIAEAMLPAVREALGESAPTSRPGPRPR